MLRTKKKFNVSEKKMKKQWIDISQKKTKLKEIDDRRRTRKALAAMKKSKTNGKNRDIEAKNRLFSSQIRRIFFRFYRDCAQEATHNSNILNFIHAHFYSIIHVD